jgi:phosphatidate phosphatase LPIN
LLVISLRELSKLPVKRVLVLLTHCDSYIHMTDLVDQMFPPIHRKWTAEFTDFNYWRTPIQEFELPDLSPPSPTLSARSDASGQSRLSRLRNFSLGRASSTQNLKVEQPSFNGQANGDGQVRSRTLSVSSNPVRRSPSPRRSPLMGPSITAHDFEEDDDVSEVASSWLERRRTTSMDGSMPGSLPGSLSSHFLDEDELGQDEDERSREDSEGIEGSDGGPGEEEVEAKAEEAFDEDLLATGEMDNIPFL